MMALGDFKLYNVFAQNVLKGWLPANILETQTNSRTNTSFILSLVGNLTKPKITDTTVNFYDPVERPPRMQDWLTGPRLETDNDGESIFYLDPVYIAQIPPSLAGSRASYEAYYLIVRTWYTGLVNSPDLMVGFVDLTPDGGATPWTLKTKSLSVSWPNGLFRAMVNR